MPAKITWDNAVGTTQSPNALYEARFFSGHEFRDGVFWYDLEIDETFVGERFADRCLWSPDSRYFAVCQFLKSTNDVMTQSQIVLFDLIRGAKCTLRSTQANGFAIPVRFDQSRLVCEQTSFSKSANIGYVFGVDLRQIESWEVL